MIKKPKESFDQLAKEFNKTNQAAIKAIAETEQDSAESQETEALSSTESSAKAGPSASNNETGLAKRLKDRTSKARMGSPSLQAPKRSSVNNAGISDNVSNGEQFVDALLSFGPSYNPVTPSYTPASLTVRNVEGRAILNEVRDSKQTKSDNGNSRREVFENLNKKFTQVFNQLVACGAPEGTINNAKSIIDLMRSKRKSIPAPGANTRSTSQRSFFRMVDHVSDFIALLASCPEYDTNEPELQLTALETYRDALISGNASASMSKATLGTTLIERNEFFNAPLTGYVDTFEATKRSVKAIFGGNSPQYYLVAQFKFRYIYT